MERREPGAQSRPEGHPSTERRQGLDRPGGPPEAEPGEATGRVPADAPTGRLQEHRQDGAARTVVLLSALVVALAGALSTAALLYPYQTSYVEGYMLEQAVRLAEGTGLYREVDLLAGPWVADNFPPLYFIALALGVEWLGVGFFFGRLLTILSVAALAVLLGRWSQRLGAPAWMALGLVALWLASPFVLRRALLVRMDYLAIVLAALGAWLYLRLHARRPGLAAWGSALLFVSAVLVRQDIVAPALALGLALWATGRRREALTLAGAGALLLALAVLLLEVATAGGFLRHVVAYNQHRYWVTSLALRGLSLVLLNFPILLAAAAGAPAAWRRGTVEGRFVALWVLLAALTSLSVGKGGATYNHFLHLLAAATLAAGPGLVVLAGWFRRLPASRPDKDPPSRPGKQPASRPAAGRSPSAGAPGPPLHRVRRPLAGRVLAVLLAVQVAVLAASPPIHSAVAELFRGDEEAQLIALVAHRPAPVLSENAGAVLQAGHRVVLEPRMLVELNGTGVWNDTGLVRSIQAEAYSVVVLDGFPGHGLCKVGCRFTPDAWTALEEHYAHNGTYGRWQVWWPSGEPAAVDAG